MGLVTIFIFSAFWVYHYVDIDIDVALGRSTTMERMVGQGKHSTVPNNTRLQVSSDFQKQTGSFTFGQYGAQSALTTVSTGAAKRPTKVRRRLSIS